MRAVAISLKALKALGRIPKDEQVVIRAAIRGLSVWPNCRNVKALSDRNGYRLRVGRYRVLFEMNSDTIMVTEVKKRDERTYS